MRTFSLMFIAATLFAVPAYAQAPPLVTSNVDGPFSG